MSKKNPLKNALILGGLAVVVLLITFLVIKPHQEKQEKDRERSALLFPELTREKIVEFKLTNPNGEFQLKRRAEANEDWIFGTTKIYDADRGSVDGMVSTILASKQESVVQGTDFASMGLQPPKFVLSINPGVGPAKGDLYLGDDTPVDYLVYAKWSDKPEVFLTTRSLRFGLEKKSADLRNKKVFSFKPETITRVDIRSLATPKAAAESFSMEKLESGWSSKLGKTEVKLEEKDITDFLGHFNSLAVTGFASEIATERDKFGFRSPLAKLVLTSNAKPPVVSTWLLSKATDPTNPKATKHYLSQVEQETTYEVADTFKDTFAVSLFKFRPKKISNVKKADLTSFTLSDGRASYEFKKDGGAWKASSVTDKEAKQGNVKADILTKALESLIDLKAKSYLDREGTWATGLAKPARAIEMRGTVDGAEKALGTVFFGKKFKADEIAVRSDGMAAAALVDFKLDEIFPMNFEHYVEAPPPVSAEEIKAAGTQSKGAQKVKLEATVKNVKDIKKLPASIVKPGFSYTAEIALSTGGKMVITFAPDKAPYTVSNFLHLARNGFYNGVKFHRVIPDFMAQGGDPTGTGRGGPGFQFDNEDNDLKHKRGSISMAHSGRNTNGSQFFLVFKPQSHLDGVHTVFGEITEGLDVLDKIKADDVMTTVEVFEIAR